MEIVDYWTTTTERKRICHQMSFKIVLRDYPGNVKQLIQRVLLGDTPKLIAQEVYLMAGQQAALTFAFAAAFLLDLDEVDPNAP